MQNFKYFVLTGDESNFSSQFSHCLCCHAVYTGRLVADFVQPRDKRIKLKLRGGKS